MSIDSKIVELFDVVQKRKKELEESGEAIKRGWKTTCSIKLPWNGSNTNIQTASVELLEELVMYLQQIAIAKQRLHTEVNIQGFGLLQWMEDIDKRLIVIESRSKKSELDELEKRLNAIVSPEQKREMELAAIMEKLS